MLKTLKFTAIALTVLLGGLILMAQTAGYDVFVPIAKYIEKGDAESLSSWFDDNLEISVSDVPSVSSKNQAKQIMKSFFATSKPSSFSIEHKAAKSNTKFAIGRLSCGADNYTVTLSVSLKGKEYKIQQLRIEKVR